MENNFTLTKNSNVFVCKQKNASKISYVPKCTRRYYRMALKVFQKKSSFFGEIIFLTYVSRSRYKIFPNINTLCMMM